METAQITFPAIDTSDITLDAKDFYFPKNPRIDNKKKGPAAGADRIEKTIRQDSDK